MRSFSITLSLVAVLAASPFVAVAYGQQTPPPATQPNQGPVVVAPSSQPPATMPSDQGSAIERGTTKAGQETGKALNAAVRATGEALDKAGQAVRRAGEWMQDKTRE